MLRTASTNKPADRSWVLPVATTPENFSVPFHDDAGSLLFTEEDLGRAGFVRK